MLRDLHASLFVERRNLREKIATTRSNNSHRALNWRPRLSSPKAQSERLQVEIARLNARAGVAEMEERVAAITADAGPKARHPQHS